MEVHAHTHTARKKWTHYFWEFLMLFLAVFCGFMAEYQLEHKIEKDRGKVYAFNLYEELKKDTANIDSTIKQIRHFTAKLDTFCLLSREKDSRKVTNGMLYYYSSFTTWIIFYVSDNTTIIQLKNSGNLRLLSNDISQKINVYGKMLGDLENEYNLTRTEFARIEELYFKLFDGYQTKSLVTGKTALTRDSLFKLNIPLIDNDPKLMKEFTGWLNFETGIYQEHIRRFLLPIKAKATELLLALKKKYHFD
ncbi:MAG: hypothetical protein ACXWCZ_09840 [Flavisolibacter sp.]